jgi:predicted nucleic acid-binding protein
VTAFLLDRDVLGELEDAHGNANVHAWSKTVPDNALYISVIAVMEARKGFARLRVKAAGGDELIEIQGYESDFDRLLEAFADRVLPIDREIADCWGELLARREANVMDAALAATAKVQGIVVATRNLRHFRGRGVRLIDPFVRRPKIAEPGV